MALRLTDVTDYVQDAANAILGVSPSGVGVPSGRGTSMVALLTDLVTLETIELFHFDDVQNSADPNWATISVRGRSEPLQFYSETGPDTWQFQFYLVASVNKSDGGTVERNYRDWLLIKQSAYPDYEGDEFARPPHLFNLRWGRAMDEVGIIKSPQATFKRPYINELPTVIEVSFTFERVNTPRGATEVRELLK